jgi:predicted dehydrogenase
MKPLAVGLVGLSHLHPRAYMRSFASVPDFAVVAAAEPDLAVREAFARDFPVRGYSGWREMLDREPLDVAAIFLPHAACPEAACACAERGIHLLVEKPMAASAEGARSMIAAARQAAVVLTTPYVWRYHPVAAQIRGFVRDGTLGRVIGCEGRCAAGRLNRYIEGHAGWMLHKSQSGGGPMYNLGVHWIDLYRWLLNDEVAAALGRNVKVNQEYDIEDNSFALLTFSRGAVLALDISYTVPAAYPSGRDLYLGLRGTAGVVAWSPSFEGVDEELFVASDAPRFDPPVRRLRFELPPHPGYSGILTVRFLEDLARAIRDGAAPAISGADGLRALEVVEAIYRSAETGREVKL